MPRMINPFQAIGLFLYPHENIRNVFWKWTFWFSDVFRGYRKRLVAWNGLSSIRMTVIRWSTFSTDIAFSNNFFLILNRHTKSAVTWVMITRKKLVFYLYPVFLSLLVSCKQHFYNPDFDSLWYIYSLSQCTNIKCTLLNHLF